MTKEELKKERLSLEYKFESSRASICFSAMIITAMGVLAGSWINGNYVIGIFLAMVLIVVASIYYSKIKKKMDVILSNLEKIKK